MKLCSLLFALTLTPLPAVLGAGENWMTDFEAAKKKAAVEKKDLLMDFTGSDWCGWCIRLSKEVFDQDPFKNSVGDHFILVELDFPRDESKLPEETLAQNKELGAKYGVEGYPTIILADAEGRPYAQTGYQEGGPAAYLKHLAMLRERRVVRDKALADAAKLEGVPKAKALLNAIGEFPDPMVDIFYAEVTEEILACDPDDETGYRKGRDYREAVTQYEERVEALFGKQEFDGVIKEAESFVTTHNPSGFDKQHILMGKAMALIEKGEERGALALLDDIKAIAPQSDIGSQIDMMKERVSAFFSEKNGPKPPDSQ